MVKSILRRHDRRLSVAHEVLLAVGLSLSALAVSASGGDAGIVEQYVDVPMPPGFHVEASEIEIPVFADTAGRTLYKWPFKGLRNGYSGESLGNPGCYDEVRMETAGLMSPYPAGVLLPELDTRPSCTDLWPPAVAADSAEPVGKWTILDRKDGTRQWAFEEHPLYTSVLDKEPGDVYGGTTRNSGGDSPAIRVPVGPPSMIPPGFAVKTTTVGRLLTTDKTYSVYAFADDTPETSMCVGGCARIWDPIIAPALALPKGEWSIIERSAGVRQWAFRQQPLYTYTLDASAWSQEGSDVPGWSNVYLQRAPQNPDAFTLQPTLVGEVLADSSGMTIYTYVCGDDSADQLSCDHPTDTQVYRLAMCGGGDADKCQDYWRYVTAAAGVQGTSRSWRVVNIDPATGHFADDGQAGALRVWAYRDRPVYTYGGDAQPGDVNGDGTGEWRGQRNGLSAFWLRDDYLRGTL